MIDNGGWINAFRKGWESQCLEGGVAAGVDRECARVRVNSFKPSCESWLEGIQCVQKWFVGSTEEGDTQDKIVNADTGGPAQT
jgi:hypothetical protein